MLDPQGPLPPEIYWRRRALAAGVLVVVLAVIVGLVFWVTGGDDSNKNTSNGSDLSSSSSYVLPSAYSDSSASASASPGGSGGTSGGGGDVALGQVDASGAPVAPGAVPAGQTPAPVPASGLCPDQNISVVLYTDKPAYKEGEQPIFTIAVTNAGLSECTRDVGKAMQSVTVLNLAGDRRIWASGDCAPVAGVNNQLLKPGQQVQDTIQWSGTTSTPGCQTPREPVVPGAYQAIAKIGEKPSAPITFNIDRANAQ
ncbi:UNVERIFIED_CONTAM: hypothetical protein DES50_101377 [Williamsia faeni]